MLNGPVYLLSVKNVFNSHCLSVWLTEVPVVTFNATQSSTHFNFVPRHAIDGQMLGSFTHTALSSDNFWQTHLIESVYVSSVLLYLRVDGSKLWMGYLRNYWHSCGVKICERICKQIKFIIKQEMSVKHTHQHAWKTTVHGARNTFYFFPDLFAISFS